MTAKKIHSPCLYMQARRADRILTRLYDSYIRPIGLKSTQYGLLRCINKLGTPSLSEISATMSVDQTTVSRNMDKLEKGGYISTTPTKTDARKTAITILPG